HRTLVGCGAIHLSVLLRRVCAFTGLPHSTCPLGHGDPPHAKRARGGAPRTPEAGKNTEPVGFRQTCHTSGFQFGRPAKLPEESGPRVRLTSADRHHRPVNAGPPSPSRHASGP